MIHWSLYHGHDQKIVGKTKKHDSTIYSFDIETSSIVILDGKIYPAINYKDFNEKERTCCSFYSFMYIWMFSIDDVVYFGRTWREFQTFIKKLDDYAPGEKIVHVHNLSFEFQYLKSYFDFEDVIARKSRHVMQCTMSDFNIIFKCTLYMTNVALKKLPKIYGLDIAKKVGDLDYSKIRTSITPLTEKELGYCEADCLVIYEYIKKECEFYGYPHKIPMTSTGKVRRELKNLTRLDWNYRGKTKKAINKDPHVYNLLVKAFAGGYTHANWLYTDTILKNVDSYDETSAYPYCLTSFKFPMTKFEKCNLKRYEDMYSNFAYLIRIKMIGVESKYYNNFISKSKCEEISGCRADNGRVISAKYLIITITDVDFRLFKMTYDFDYEILESYSALYRYLPIQLINFILDKYELKTTLKNVEGKEIEYNLEKAKFNSIYGMCVTNMIRDEVIYDNDSGWSEDHITNKEIIEKLEKEEKASFLSFAWGCWCTSISRYNLISNIIKQDYYCAYADTDSMKLVPGYDKKAIENYNDKVRKRIEHVSKSLDIPMSRFEPEDIKGKKHLLGLFEYETTTDNKEHTYREFVTQRS